MGQPRGFLSPEERTRLTFFAFDLIYANGHDLRRCPIEQRKALLKDVLDHAGCERIVYVDHIMGEGDRLFEHVRAMGAEGIVSKRLGCSYRHGDWLKTKCYQVGRPRFQADSLSVGSASVDAALEADQRRLTFQSQDAQPNPIYRFQGRCG